MLFPDKMVMAVDGVKVRYAYGLNSQTQEEYQQLYVLKTSVLKGLAGPKARVWSVGKHSMTNVEIPFQSGGRLFVRYGYCSKRHWSWISFNPAQLDVDGYAQLQGWLDLLFTHGALSLIEYGRVAQLDIALDVRDEFRRHLFLDRRLFRHHQVIGFESAGYTRRQAEDTIARIRAGIEREASKKKRASIRLAQAAVDYLSSLDEHDGNDIKAKTMPFREHLIPHLGHIQIAKFDDDDGLACISRRKAEGASGDHDQSRAVRPAAYVQHHAQAQTTAERPVPGTSKEVGGQADLSDAGREPAADRGGHRRSVITCASLRDDRAVHRAASSPDPQPDRGRCRP